MTEIIQISLITLMFCALGDKGMVFNFYRRLIKRLPDWLSFPLGACHKCFTGQVCFWYLIITRHTFFEVMFLTSFGIMMSMVYAKIYYWLDDIN